MKLVWGTTLILTLFTSLSLQARDSLSLIKGFELSSCNPKKKCIQLKSQEAESGTFTPIMVFYDYNLEIKEGDKTRAYKGARGYYDNENKKIVVRLIDKKELEINIEDLSERTF